MTEKEMNRIEERRLIWHLFAKKANEMSEYLG